MSKQNNNKNAKKSGIKNLDLYIILASITVLAIITAILLWTRPFEAKSFEEIKDVTVENYNTQNNNEKEYFVLLWDSRQKVDERLSECAVRYAEYARTHENAPAIYVIDYRDDKDIINSSNFNISSVNLETNVPCLGTISTSGSVTNKKTNVSDICNLLEDYMSGRK